MHSEDAEREHVVGAVVECNMAVRLEEFARIGGFAEDMRFHEIHDLAMKLRSIDKSIWYIPEGVAKKYNYGDVRSQRAKEMKDSSITFMKNRLLGRYRKKKDD